MSDGLDKLTDAMVEDILETSDEDILAEAREDGINPEAIASEWRAWLDRIIAERFEAP
jgi:hypothetical protein